MRISFTENNQPEKTVELQLDEINIGKDAGNDLVLRDASVSRIHCRISLRGGRIIVEDLNSANGTHVNGKLLTGPCAVSPLDEIHVGAVSLRVEDSDDDEDLPTPISDTPIGSIPMPRPLSSEPLTEPSREARWYSLAPSLRAWYAAIAGILVALFISSYRINHGHEDEKFLGGLFMIALLGSIIPFVRRRRSWAFWGKLQAKIQFSYRADGVLLARVAFCPKTDVTLPGVYLFREPSFATKQKSERSPSSFLEEAGRGALQMSLFESLPLKANQVTTIELPFEAPAGGGRDDVALFALPEAQPPIGVSFSVLKSAGVAQINSRWLLECEAPQAPQSTGDYREGVGGVVHQASCANNEYAAKYLLSRSQAYFFGALSFVVGLVLFMAFMGSTETQMAQFHIGSALSLIGLGALFYSGFRWLPIGVLLFLAGLYYQNTHSWSGFHYPSDMEWMQAVLIVWSVTFAGTALAMLSFKKRAQR
jgi:hypothetical protein